MIKKKAVVCDHDATFARILKHLLAKQGFEVSTAHNSDGGLALLRSAKPSLLILDMELATKDGLAVLRGMRDASAAKPYTIVLTAHEGKEKHAQATALGAHEVWTKPFSAAEFLKKLESLARQGKV